MIAGTLFDTLRSAPHRATIEAAPDGRWRLSCNGEDSLLDPATMRVSERIGSIPRRLHLPGGGEFETADNDGVDQLLRESGLGVPAGIVHQLERSWGVAIAALALVILSFVGLFRYGLPSMANWAAKAIPTSADKLIGAESLRILDAGFLDPSKLDEQRQDQLYELFWRVIRDIDDDHEYLLELRDSPRFGANAFALPSGIVLLTDDLVALAKDDEELMAVLAHEIGHVRGRHALRQMIEATGISLVAVIVLGDVSSVSALASAAPALLQARNSRELEREADGFARQWLEQHHLPATRFDDLICRLEVEQGVTDDVIGQFLASHPPTSERAHCREKGS
jgi:Zn-dependent protease with chaperone function